MSVARAALVNWLTRTGTIRKNVKQRDQSIAILGLHNLFGWVTAAIVTDARRLWVCNGARPNAPPDCYLDHLANRVVEKDGMVDSKRMISDGRRVVLTRKPLLTR